MAGNSLLRRILKRTLAPVLDERRYRYLQSVAMAWDIRTGGWSEPEVPLLPSLVRPGETALDLGANFGLYTYHLSRCVGRGGRVYAFEPLAFACETLRLVARWLRLGNAWIEPVGCSDRGERVLFRVPLQSSGAIDATQAYAAFRNDERPGKEEWVTWSETRETWCDLVRLDDYLPPLERLSLIKCDVQGAELKALRGAEALLDQHHPTVLCEIHTWLLEGFGAPLEDLLSWMEARGYALYRYDAVRRRLVLPTERELKVEYDPVHPNYLFLHSSKRERVAGLVPEAG